MILSQSTPKMSRRQSAYLARARRNGYRVVSKSFEADGTMVVHFRGLDTPGRCAR